MSVETCCAAAGRGPEARAVNISAQTANADSPFRARLLLIMANSWRLGLGKVGGMLAQIGGRFQLVCLVHEVAVGGQRLEGASHMRNVYCSGMTPGCFLSSLPGARAVPARSASPCLRSQDQVGWC